MCTLCTEHGFGEKWYFHFDNYLFHKVFPTPEEKEQARSRYIHTLADTDRYGDPEYNHDAPYLQQKFRTTPGQVITLEEATKVMDIAEEAARREDTLVVLSRCNCALTYRGKLEYRCIVFGIPVSWASEVGYTKYPREGLTELGGAQWREVREWLNQGRRVPLKAEEARELLREWGKKGLHHTLVSRGLLPLIDGICNCEAPYCMRIRHRRLLGLEGCLLKGHFVARIEPEKCNACGACMTRCDFGAIRSSKWSELAYVEAAQCYGCGICRLACRSEAITMVPREAVSAARGRW